MLEFNNPYACTIRAVVVNKINRYNGGAITTTLSKIDRSPYACRELDNLPACLFLTLSYCILKHPGNKMIFKDLLRSISRMGNVS